MINFSDIPPHSAVIGILSHASRNAQNSETKGVFELHCCRFVALRARSARSGTSRLPPQRLSDMFALSLAVPLGSVQDLRQVVLPSCIPWGLHGSRALRFVSSRRGKNFSERNARGMMRHTIATLCRIIQYTSFILYHLVFYDVGRSRVLRCALLVHAAFVGLLF